MNTEQRRAILQREISHYVKRGYIVVSQTDTTAQLVKHKRFSLLWAVFWFLFLVVGFVLYLIWYLAKRDQTVYIDVGPDGRVTKR